MCNRHIINTVIISVFNHVPQAKKRGQDWAFLYYLPARAFQWLRLPNVKPVRGSTVMAEATEMSKLWAIMNWSAKQHGCNAQCTVTFNWKRFFTEQQQICFCIFQQICDKLTHDRTYTTYYCRLCSCYKYSYCIFLKSNIKISYHRPNVCITLQLF